MNTFIFPVHKTLYFNWNFDKESSSDWLETYTYDKGSEANYLNLVIQTVDNKIVVKINSDYTVTVEVTDDDDVFITVYGGKEAPWL